MCRNGRYTERGIKELDGDGSELWCVEADYAVKLDPRLEHIGMLMEPTTVVAKAWEQVHSIGRRAWFEPSGVLVTGAGPIGLLAALLGVQQGLDMHVLDRVTEGPKPRLVESLGATYHHEPVDEVAGRLQPDVVIEATGATRGVFDAMANTASYGIVCLTGVSPAGRTLSVDAGTINLELVFGKRRGGRSVNANHRHDRHPPMLWSIANYRVARQFDHPARSTRAVLRGVHGAAAGRQGRHHDRRLIIGTAKKREHV